MTDSRQFACTSSAESGQRYHLGLDDCTLIVVNPTTLKLEEEQAPFYRGLLESNSALPARGALGEVHIWPVGGETELEIAERGIRGSIRRLQLDRYNSDLSAMKNRMGGQTLPILFWRLSRTRQEVGDVRLIATAVALNVGLLAEQEKSDSRIGGASDESFVREVENARIESERLRSLADLQGDRIDARSTMLDGAYLILGLFCGLAAPFVYAWLRSV